MSGAEKALATLREYVERSTHWKEGGADRHDAKLALNELDDAIEWIEKGIDEWRSMYVVADRNEKTAQAISRIAIGHLQAVINKPRSHDEQQSAGKAARDWLVSMGSEPT